MGFERLTKLQLDNNIIRKIENLDHLVNLRWLDLSFNNITKIEGLDKLTQLTDLSLFNNEIVVIENLERLVNLNVLSLGNNNIQDVAQIKTLRNFQNLRLLNLKGNPIYTEDDYQPTVFAYLVHLKYLDYELIEPSEFQKARDAKLDAIVELEELEKQQAAAKREEDAKQAVLASHREANVGAFSGLFDQILLADTEHAKLQLLPGFQDVLQEYRSVFEAISSGFLAVAMQKHADGLAELALFEKVSSRVIAGKFSS